MGGGHSISAVQTCEPVIRAFSLVGRHLTLDASVVSLFGPLRTIRNSNIPTDGELVEAVRVVLLGSWSISVVVKNGAVMSCSELTRTISLSKAFLEMAYDNEMEADRMAVVAIIGLCHAICDTIPVKLAQLRNNAAVPIFDECITLDGMQPLLREECESNSGYVWEDAVLDGRITWNKSSQFKTQLLLFQYIRSKVTGWKLIDSVVLSDDYVRRILGNINATRCSSLLRPDCVLRLSRCCL
jgi:hypothetical protein